VSAPISDPALPVPLFVRVPRHGRTHAHSCRVEYVEYMGMLDMYSTWECWSTWVCWICTGICTRGVHGYVGYVQGYVHVEYMGMLDMYREGRIPQGQIPEVSLPGSRWGVILMPGLEMLWVDGLRAVNGLMVNGLAVNGLI